MTRTTTDIRRLAAVFLCAPLAAAAADVTVNGLFPGKAIIQVDGGRPRTVAVGETTPDGVKLISATHESAVVEYGGRRETLAPGQGTRVGAGAAPSGTAHTTLTADAQGHFLTTGLVNGQPVRFMVDTGASAVVLSAAEARRLGLNYLAAPRAMVQTANGIAPVHRMKIDTLRIGAITAYNVDAVITDGHLPVMLLGMSFLNRTEMRRDGDTMTLTRRY